MSMSIVEFSHTIKLDALTQTKEVTVNVSKLKSRHKHKLIILNTMKLIYFQFDAIEILNLDLKLGKQNLILMEYS